MIWGVQSLEDLSELLVEVRLLCWETLQAEWIRSWAMGCSEPIPAGRVLSCSRPYSKKTAKHRPFSSVRPESDRLPEALLVADSESERERQSGSRTGARLRELSQREELPSFFVELKLAANAKCFCTCSLAPRPAAGSIHGFSRMGAFASRTCGAKGCRMNPGNSVGERVRVHSAGGNKSARGARNRF
jgi:hypothetical protein